MSQSPFTENANSLVNQLNDATDQFDTAYEQQGQPQKQDLEQFVIARASTLINQSLDAVAGFKMAVTQAPNAADAEALSTLITATANALDVVNRIVLMDKKVVGAKQIRQMDIDARKEITDVRQGPQRLLTREEVMRMLSAGDSIVPSVSSEIIDVIVYPDCK